VKAHHLGKVFAAETGFTIARNPDTTRAPDVGVRQKKIECPKGRLRGFFPGAPDLAVRSRFPLRIDYQTSPRKVDQWLAAGTQSVWVVDPGQIEALRFIERVGGFTVTMAMNPSRMSRRCPDLSWS